MTLTFGTDTVCPWCVKGYNRGGEVCRHCEGTTLNPREVAVARRSDPETSREAAAAMSPERIEGDRLTVLSVLRRNGPMTDNRLVELIATASEGKPALMSPSGARTRRSELTGDGLVEAAGTVTLPSNRRATVWRAVR